MWLFRRLRENQRGAVLVEAAFVLPMLIMLAVGIWSTARAWNIHNVLDHAAREAARYGATSNPFDSGEVLTIAEGEVDSSRVDWSSVATCTALVNSGSGGPCIGTDPTSDRRVQVTLQVSNHSLNFVFFSIPVDLRAEAVARYEPTR